MSARKPAPRQREAVLFDAEVMDEWLQKDRGTDGICARKGGRA